MKYEYQKACKCGNVDSIEVTRKEAAFGLKEKEIWSQECSKCGNKEFTSLSHPQPEFKTDLLIEWGNNADYFFMEQDEDLMLADEKYIDLILEVLDNHQILSQKRNVLIEALCVIIYDNNVSDENNSDLTDRVAKELKKRKADVLNAQDWIMDYIKEVSFPIIGIEYVSKKTNSSEHKEKNNIWNKLKQIWN
ncbi:hypothetical protein [Olleya marilimosa]|uniref:hypothetical protein n=1 Tax=Olleya marilimosa TaxID=272164 RepID=UPI00048010B6|nr:hypothetical protein [Olleya marilimosa]